MADSALFYCIQRITPLVLCGALLVSATGCKQSQRLAAEIVETERQSESEKVRLDSLNRELMSANEAYGVLRRHTTAKNKLTATLDQEVKTLKATKESLESEIAVLRGQREAYLKLTR